MPEYDTKVKKLRRLSILLDVVKIVFVSTILVVCVRSFVAQPFVVSGDSMVPTFYPNDYVVIDELTYELHKPQRGDIVIFQYPLDPSIFFIKRLIGLPGDTVVVNNGSVYVQTGKLTQRLLTEPYLRAGAPKIESGTTTLGTDEYYVLGDNRNSSFDSRVWGPVPARYIVGRVLVRLFPFTHATVYARPTGATSTAVK